MAQYLSPRNDYGFKKLFGHEDHKKLTKSFLNTILGRVKGNLISEIHFRETEKIPEPADGRRSFLDVHCIDEQGKHFIIEMSSFAHNIKSYDDEFAATADKQFQ